ncbi:MAG: D-alanyl-D-alanine carboxypeptidase/D-alanyl-D-alanine-endopeptidase [Arcanobacterium sp.]
MKKIKVIATLLTLTLCGYIFADAWDVVPGVFTTKPLVAEALPYPESSEVEANEAVLPELAQPTAPDAATVSAAIKEMLDDEKMSGTAAVLVIDPLTGETIVDVNSRTPVIPASNLKYYTAAASLHAMGPDATFTTSVKLSGTELYLVGGGDIMLAAGAGDPTAANGRAGLGDLASETAEALSAAGVTTVSLYVDSSLFSGALYHPEIAGTPDEKYVMEMRTISVNRAIFEEEGDEWPTISRDADLQTAQIFADHLAQAGIEVTAVDRGVAGDDAEIIASVQSAPVRDIVAFMMSTSDNSVADALGRMVAVTRGQTADYNGATKAIVEVLKEEGYPMDGVRMSDCSGLADGSLATAVSISAILQEAWNCNDCDLASLPSSLAVSALSGTLDDRYVDSPLAGEIRAKTGTLNEATSLSGYLRTGSGYPLIFSIIVSDHEPYTNLDIRALMDTALRKIAAS